MINAHHEEVLCDSSPARYRELNLNLTIQSSFFGVMPQRMAEYKCNKCLLSIVLVAGQGTYQ